MQTIDTELKKETEFSLIRFEGLTAFTDIYVIQEEALMFLSLFGSRVSVRAIWSALLESASVSLGNETLKLDSKAKWHVLQKLTPSGVLHAICLPDLLEIAKVRDEFLVLGTTREEMEWRFFLYLDRISETPISPEWCSWIFKKALCDEKAKWLKATNIFAVQYRHDETWLEGQITNFLKRKMKIAV